MPDADDDGDESSYGDGDDVDDADDDDDDGDESNYDGDWGEERDRRGVTRSRLTLGSLAPLSIDNNKAFHRSPFTDLQSMSSTVAHVPFHCRSFTVLQNKSSANQQCSNC